MSNAAEKAVAYRYPKDVSRHLEQLLDQGIALDQRIYVVIDDDPTGSQTVHDIEVYTVWDEPNLLHAFARAKRMFYIMTNSRSMKAEDSRAVHREIMKNLESAAAKAHKRYAVISRGDSTLRGHYPLEPDTIAQTLGGGKHLLIPYFREGDRYTVQDIHYLCQDDKLIPVGESEFSRDKTFGYQASDLKEWILEKTEGKVRREWVGSIGLDMLRALDFTAIEAVLRGPCSYIVVNATCDDDLRAFAVAYLRAVAAGERFVARTAAGWPKVIGGIKDAPLLECGDMVQKGNTQGGLVVVGSHVKKTTEQLEALRQAMPQISCLEFDQHLALDPRAIAGEIRRVSRAASACIRAGRTCVVYTRRARLDVQGSQEDELRITRRIADAVTRVVCDLEARPSFLVAKGGITSSDIAVKALGVERALIKGQVAPGVPVWQMGAGSKYPGMAYIIFPGNVGARNALKEIVQKLCER